MPIFVWDSRKSCVWLGFKPGAHQADGRPSGSVRQASLFGVFHSSALVGLTLAVVCPIQRTVGERDNSDWMFSLANESVQEN